MRATRLAVGILATLGSGLIAAASTSPATADTNLASWAVLIGFQNPPRALITANSGRWLWIAGLACIALAALALLDLWFSKRRSKAEQAAPTNIPPVVAAAIARTLNDHSEGKRTFVDPLTVHKPISAISKSAVSLTRTIDRTADRDASLREGLSYAAFGSWTVRPIEAFEAGDSDKYLEALRRFHQLAADGALRSWGIADSFQASNVHTAIHRDYWRYAEIDYLDALREKPFGRSKVPGAIDYTDIRVNRAEFERAWAKPAC